MMKKFLVMIMISVLSISCVACSDNSDKKEKNTTETTTTKEEVTTTKKEETTTKEEATTTEKTFEDLSFNIMYSPFLVDYKDFVIEHFNNKSFKKGDTFDCKAEIEALGLDVNEYGKVFSSMYFTIIGGSEKCSFKANDQGFDEMYFIPIVDNSHNYAGTNNTEEPFHIEISFDKPESVTFHVVFD